MRQGLISCSSDRWWTIIFTIYHFHSTLDVFIIGSLQPIYKLRTGLTVRRSPTARDRCECWCLVAYFYMLLCSCSCFVKNSSLNCHIMLSWFTFGLRVSRLKVETLLFRCLWFHYFADCGGSWRFILSCRWQSRNVPPPAPLLAMWLQY